MAKKEAKPLTEFSRPTVRAILDECQEALAPIAEKYGLTLDRKSGSYHADALPVMYKFLIKEIGADGNELTAAGKDFISHASMHGLEPSDLGKEFRRGGKTYKISGFKPRSYKLPVLGQDVKTGKTFKFAVEDVLLALKRAA